MVRTNHKFFVFIGSKSGIDPDQLTQRIEIQLRLEKELSYSGISFKYIEIQPPANLNRDLTIDERRIVDQARENGFSIGFEFPHLWYGRDVDPLIPDSMKDIMEITHIASNLNVDYLTTNPGDLQSRSFDHKRWKMARDAHLFAVSRIKEVHPCIGIENSNPIRHLDSESVYGFFGMIPEDLCLFDFIVLDIAHAQFTVNHFQAQRKLESITSLEQIHKRNGLSLNDYITMLKDKIQVVHVANAIGLGDIEKEGLVMSEGEADCSEFITNVLKNRSTPIRFVAEPSNIPYGIDFCALGDLMYSEEKEIFKSVLQYQQRIKVNNG